MKAISQTRLVFLGDAELHSRFAFFGARHVRCVVLRKSQSPHVFSDGLRSDVVGNAKVRVLHQDHRLAIVVLFATKQVQLIPVPTFRVLWLGVGNPDEAVVLDSKYVADEGGGLGDSFIFICNWNQVTSSCASREFLGIVP